MTPARDTARPARPAVTLRPVEDNDCLMLHEWQKDPETRRFARNPAVPSLEDHTAWFEMKRSDPTCLFWVILADGVPAGSLRLDCAPDGASCEVSISVDQKHRGMGIAGEALRLARRQVPDALIRAFVMDDNAASRALFLGTGYDPQGEGWYHSAPAKDTRR